MAVLIVLSLVDVQWDDGFMLSVRATIVTAALIATIWLPSVLQLVGKYGGTISAAGVGLGIEAIRQMGAARPTTPSAPTASAVEPTASGLTSLEAQYETLQRRMRPSFERSTALETVIAEARLAASDERDELPDRLVTFASDGEGARIVTLALLQGLPGMLPAAAADLLADAVTANRSSFEEYHVLRTLRDRFGDLDVAGRDRAVANVRRLLDSGHYPRGSDRLGLAKQVVQLGGS